MPLDTPAIRLAALIQTSAGRMATLIDNVLDFARGRLGGGLAVTRVAGIDLRTPLEHVIAELREAWPDRMIDSDLALDRPVPCDAGRIAQLLSNLVANALSHGDRTGPVVVRGHSNECGLELSVTNRGTPIAPATLGRLFQPFSRPAARPGHRGLGLGLYIASEIARAHDGTLAVESTLDQTRFTFRMPPA